MADDLFNVVFRGDVLPGYNLADVKARFAQLFKMDVAKAEGFFSGKPLVLKPNCDRATADKFKAVLEQAGAQVEIRSTAQAQAQALSQPAAAPKSASAPVAPAVSAAPTSATPVPISSASASSAAAVPAAQAPWSLFAPGSQLLRPDEKAAPALAAIDTSHLSIVKRKLFSDEPEEPLEPARPAVQANINLSAFSLGGVGETLVPEQAFVPLDIDLSELSLGAVGADVLSESERTVFVPANIDTSGVDIAPAGSDMGQTKPPPAPPAPDTGHISLQK